jgi:hypothetical protein
MPMVHRNTLKFIGMDSKQKYLIWHEAKGCFSALHKESGTIQTWSIPTGKLLKTQHTQHKDKDITKFDISKLEGFEIFAKDRHDTAF